jgi:hypothetical protein
VLCCAVLLCFSAPAPLLVLYYSPLLCRCLPVVVRVLREGARVTWVCWCWLSCCRGTLVLSPGIRSLVCWGSQGRYFPAVRSGLVGVDVAEHLVPSCSIHHDVLPCRSWDLAEEGVDFSRRSLLVVVSFVVVAAFAVVAVAVIAVLWSCGGGCIAWFACGDGVLLSVGGWGGGGGRERERVGGGGGEGYRAADGVEEVEGAAGGAATAV